MKRQDVDMSARAIDSRLRQISDLRRLCLELAVARVLGPADEVSETRSTPERDSGASGREPPRS